MTQYHNRERFSFVVSENMVMVAAVRNSCLLLSSANLQVSCVDTHAHEDAARLTLVRLYKKMALIELNIYLYH